MTITGQEHYSHRQLTIRKVENGFMVQAQFLLEEKNWEGKQFKNWKPLEYCYYTVEEALNFAKEYLMAPANTLEKII